jgi:hypothetical protein
MALLAPAFVTVNPSLIEPDLLLPYAQASGAFDLIEGGEPRVKLSEGDLYVYMKRVDLRTSMAAGPASYNSLPGVNVAFSQISTPTYLLQVRAIYNHHDQAAAQQWGVGLPEAYRLGMRQGHFQLARSALLYGFNPQNGEGLLNAAGATAVNLPADSQGATTVITYDNGQMAFFLLQQLGAIKIRTNQLGIGRKFTICGPQRVLEQFEYPGIVQLTQYQRVGAGTTTTAGVVKEVAMMNGDTLMWTYDDTLIGKGAGGNDAVIITMPEVEKPKGDGMINTNEFAGLKPGNDACLTMYADQAAPKEITSPLAGGATDVLSEWRITSGWAIRPEAITIASMQYQ